MDFPFLLLVLLTLPLVAAALIVTVSTARRRGRAPLHQAASEPVHRLQADSAATQEAAVHPPAPAPPAASARIRRAALAKGPQDR
jgi:hypothetical protein